VRCSSISPMALRTASAVPCDYSGGIQPWISSSW
jgi:hypothetical protein